MAGGDSPRLNPLVRFIATGAYVGYAPLAPGTAATFAYAVLYWLLAPEITAASGALALATLAISMAAVIVLAMWAAGAAETVLGKDSSRIVVDELAGFLVAVALLPKSIFVLTVSFLLFRVLDILKPFPARRLEALEGGAGVVLDDLVAGIYTNLLVRLMMLARGW